MAQEDQNHTATSAPRAAGINNGRSSRKQKNVPQRGLGVAQLEKIRIEELQKKDAAAAAALVPHSILPSSPTHLSKGTVPLFIPNNADAELGRHSDNIVMRNMWTPTHLGTDLETMAGDPSNALRPNWNTQCEPDPVWPPPAGPIPRVQLDYLNQVHAALVHSAPALATSSSSTLLNYPMEPPSNQIYHHNYYISVAPEVVGSKRADPFSLENPLVPPPLRSRTGHQIGRSKHPISHGNGNSSNHEPGRGNSRFPSTTYPNQDECRNGLSVSGSNSEPGTNSTRGSRGNGILGEVLTLAPPSTSSTWPNARHVDTEPTLAPSNHFHDLSSQRQHPHSQQGRGEEPGGYHQYYYNFVPHLIPRDARADTRGSRKDDEEAIDLELRLGLGSVLRNGARNT